MKKIFSLLFLIVTSVMSEAQDTLKINDSVEFIFCSKGNFMSVDSMEYWNYDLRTIDKGQHKDSVQPIANVIFFRSRPLQDSFSRRIYGKDWSPVMEFSIYKLSDSAFCSRRSLSTRFLSSCVPPDVGGDIIITGNFIFLNNDVCLHCRKYDTKIDYCRPVVNSLFGGLDKNKLSSIEEIVAQFPIKWKVWD